MGKRPVREWTPSDEGLLYTLWVVSSLLRGRADQLQYVNPPFAIDYPAGERVYNSAPFQLREWGAPGDGSYMHNSSFFFATGRGGLTMTAAAAAIRAAGNSNRRSQAAQNAVPRWMPADQGTIWVSSLGFWMQTMRGLFPWPWESVHGMEIVGQGNVQVYGQSTNGPMTWQIVSPAAELLFGLWVITRKVPHPQWMDRSWIPPNWIRWATDLGKNLPFDDPTEVDVSMDALPPSV